MNQGGLPTSLILETIIPASLSCMACIWLFITYPKQAKSTGLKMILTLSISDFIYHITVLMTLMQFPGLLDTIIRSMVGVSVYFSTIWPSAIAFLVYRSSRQTAFIDTEKYFKLSLGLVTVLSVVLTQA